MNIQTYVHTQRLRAVAVLVAVALLAGCGKKPEAQASFKTPEDAVAAFVAALQKDDVPALQHLLGPDTGDLLDSGDAVADKADRAGFVAAYQLKHSLVAEGADKMTLVTGENDWAMPIPIVKRDGKWYLDGAAGADELTYRRVGANELGAIDVCRGYVQAQFDYADAGHDGDPPGIFALKLLSDEGLQNGLYWETTADEPTSPAGAAVAAAAEEGYRSAGAGRTPYPGYYYRMLYAQGEHANGGARDYFKDGLYTEGFALIAWPADYGSSGVQTFIVNQDGIVFQKDLGEDTATVVEAINVYDPDSSWVAVVPPEEPAPAAAPDA